MEVIATIHDADIGSATPAPSVYQTRRASRGVVFDSSGHIALLNAKAKCYHKLPGGGVEESESAEEALRREVHEEIGCKITNVRELGIVEEFRNDFKLHQTSFCFVADLEGMKGMPQLEPDEVADGFVTEWLPFVDATEHLKTEIGNVEDYKRKFIALRDFLILKEAITML